MLFDSGFLFVQDWYHEQNGILNGKVGHKKDPNMEQTDSNHILKPWERWG